MQNEILKPVLATDETAIPRYDIVNPDGSVAQQNVELRLKNEVMQQGTPYDEESVLPATLREKLGLSFESTPADALLAILSSSGGAVIKNSPPTATDEETVGKLWIIPKMVFHNLIPNAISPDSSQWVSNNGIVSTSANSLTLTGDGTDLSMNTSVNLLTNPYAGHKIYVHADVYLNDDSNELEISILCNNAVLFSKVVPTPTAGNTIKVRGQFISTGEPLTLLLRSVYNTSSSQANKSFTVSNLCILDLTNDQALTQIGNEFSVTQASEYIEQSGIFQYKEYEYSMSVWMLRGYYDGNYIWTIYTPDALLSDYLYASVEETDAYTFKYTSSPGGVTFYSNATNKVYTSMEIKNGKLVLTNQISIGYGDGIGRYVYVGEHPALIISSGSSGSSGGVSFRGYNTVGLTVGTIKSNKTKGIFSRYSKDSASSLVANNKAVYLGQGYEAIAKTHYVQYIGTGDYSSVPTIINCAIQPKLVYVLDGSTHGIYTILAGVLTEEMIANNALLAGTTVLDTLVVRQGNTITLSHRTSAQNQLNTSGVTYTCLIFG